MPEEQATFHIEKQAAGRDIYNVARDANINQPITIQNLTIVINSSSPEEFSQTQIQKSVNEALEKIVPELRGALIKDAEIQLTTDQRALLDAVKKKEEQGAVRNPEILRTLGNEAYYLGRMDEAFNYFQKALAIDEELKDVRGKAIMLNNIGSVYQDWGKPQEALNYYQQALAIFEELNDKRSAETVRTNIAGIKKPHSFIKRLFGK